jgi:hypothetical protein
MEYLDFELEIRPGSGREYPVTVLRSPAGEAREVMRFPFDQITLESRLDKVQIALLRSGGLRRTVMSPEELVVQEFGQVLFEAAFTGEVRNRYDVSFERAAQKEQGLRLKLREVTEIVQRNVDRDAIIIFGAVIDPLLKGIRVLIVTSIPATDGEQTQTLGVSKTSDVSKHTYDKADLEIPAFLRRAGEASK